MFGRCIQTIFNVMLPPKKVNGNRTNLNIKNLNVGDKVFVNSYLGKNPWELGKIIQNSETFCLGSEQLLRHVSDIQTKSTNIKE